MKVHHCMVDGVGGMELLEQLLSASPRRAADVSEPPAWTPRPAPGPARLLVDAAFARSRAPVEAARAIAGALRHPRRTAAELSHAFSSMGEALREGFRFVDSTPHNRPIGGHRRVAWLTLDLAEAKALRKRLACTVNDVVLADVAGGVRRFLLARDAPLAGLDYRVVVPVNMRAFREGTEDGAGNRVSAWFLSLPVSEADPVRRVERIQAETARLRASDSAVGMDLFTRIVDWTGSSRLTYAGVQLAARVHPYNLIVSNVPGPQFPLYLLGARMLALHPQGPLFQSQGLTIAAISYDGQLCFGLVGDWDVVPDLDEVARGIREARAELVAAVGEEPG
jgi:WS/DGAT/MGAT family acyltransferase